MSDFLNFNVQDEILNGDPEFDIVQKANGKYEIDLATEVIQEGTDLNKVTFDKLKKVNTIMGYGKINGVYDDTTGIIEYTHPFLNNTTIDDNLLVLAQINNKPSIPETGLNISKAVFQIGRDYTDMKGIKYNDGSVLVVGCGNENINYRGYASIIDENGLIIKSSTQIGNYLSSASIVKLDGDDEKVMVIGYNGKSPYTTYYAIIDKNLNVTTQLTSLGSAVYWPNAIKLSNGNIMVYGNYNGGTNCYICILNQSGTIIKNWTNIGSNLYTPKAIQMSNKNILVLGCVNSTSPLLYRVILDENGNILSSVGSLGINCYHPQVEALDNGNYMIVGGSKNALSGSGNYLIIEEDATIVKSGTSIGTNFGYPTIKKMINGNVIVFGTGSSQSDFIIFDEDGEVVKEVQTIGVYSERTTIFETANNNIILAGCNGSRQGVLALVDTDGNIIDDVLNLGNYSMLNMFLIQLNNGKIFVGGYQASYDNYQGDVGIIETESFFNGITLNGIPVDTRLEQNKYYRFLYKENINKFLVNEENI